METYLKKAVNNKRLDKRYKRREYSISRDRDYGSFRDWSIRSHSYDRRMTGMATGDMVLRPKMAARRVTTAR